VVRRGMWKVVNEQGGTGGKARIKGVEVAGKTGTAQFKRKVGNELVKDNRVWFMCFAPYKQPKYVVVVMVEGAKSGGGVAAPIATKIMRGALALEAGVEPTVAQLPPVHGNFDIIDQVTLSEDGKLSRLVAQAFQGTDQRPDDDEVSTQNDDAPVESRIGSTSRPVVREVADERGRVVSPRPQKKPNFFQRLFGPKQPKSAPVPYGRPR
jgi:penicillin-binding protein 2